MHYKSNKDFKCLKAGEKIWSEVARPQVHGHDLSCLDVISPTLFATGAEEKVIRVFRATKNFRDNYNAVTENEERVYGFAHIEASPNNCDQIFSLAF